MRDSPAYLSLLSLASRSKSQSHWTDDDDVADEQKARNRVLFGKIFDFLPALFASPAFARDAIQLENSDHTGSDCRKFGGSFRVVCVCVCVCDLPHKTSTHTPQSLQRRGQASLSIAKKECGRAGRMHKNCKTLKNQHTESRGLARGKTVFYGAKVGLNIDFWDAGRSWPLRRNLCPGCCCCFSGWPRPRMSPMMQSMLMTV